MNRMTPIERARRTRAALLELWPIIEKADAYAREYDYGEHGAGFLHGALYAASVAYERRHGEDPDLYSDLDDELHDTIRARGNLSERILRSVGAGERGVTPGNTGTVVPVEEEAPELERDDAPARPRAEVPDDRESLDILFRGLRPFAFGLHCYFVAEDGSGNPLLLGAGETGTGLTAEGSRVLSDVLRSAEEAYPSLFAAACEFTGQSREVSNTMLGSSAAVRIWIPALTAILAGAEPHGGGASETLYAIWCAGQERYEEAVAVQGALEEDGGPS